MFDQAMPACKQLKQKCISIYNSSLQSRIKILFKKLLKLLKLLLKSSSFFFQLTILNKKHGFVQF